MKHAPPITDILVRCLGGTEQRPPREQVIRFLSASNDPSAVAYINSCREIKAEDLRRLSIEAICVHAQVSPLQVLGAVLTSAKSMKSMESALKSILSHPDVVQTTIDSANLLGPAGTADRKLMHEAIGFLPTKKGGDFNINFGFGRPKEERDEDTDADADWDEAFPSLGEQIQEMSSNKHKLLESGK